MNSRFRLLTCALALFSAAVASAQTVINVAFGSTPYTGLSAVPGSTSSDVWNLWSAPNGAVDGSWLSGALVDATGAATLVEGEARSTTDQLWNGGIPGNAITLFDSYWHLSGLGTLTVTISGLAEYSVHDLYIYGARRTDDPDILVGPGSSAFTVGSTTLTTSYDGSVSSFDESINYVRFVSLVADSKGMIIFTADESISNGFSLVSPTTPVPEPATYAALAGLAALGLAIQYRRRKTA
ncbi:MAG: PEP-CTERM sorting domain-containing protein [Verrucomicrobia bacterium]|nr:PEP-CTERM sorting domain-containing protein [Verrucomicrobiota bacterium]